MTSLILKVLGPLQVEFGRQSLTEFRTNKVRALLIFLSTEPDLHSRESLMELLWPGLPERSARANLRQITYYLRKDIPDMVGSSGEDIPILVANRQAIGLNSKAGVSVDARQFEEHLDRTTTHDHLDLYLCPDCRSDLESAIALYRGNFLEDFYLEDSNVFEDWAQARRESYRRKALDALETLTTIAMRRKEYAQARQYAERQMDIDNLRESAYRRLMETMAISGQRAEAMAVFENWRRLLSEELGMAPSKQTLEVYEKIVDGEVSFDSPTAQGVRGYELKDEIGEGAYGRIHRAIQPSVGREVAVKVIRRKYANDPEFIRRFEAEAHTIARLEHPFIVPLYDYWRDPEGAYLVMRYIRGGNLLSTLASGPWDLGMTSKMLNQIASALSAAHHQGVVHRDIKPANILLDESGNAYLSDFGIAKDLNEEIQLTREGSVVGTFDYVSPEQILNDPVTARTDIYSLGAVLYETLTGEKPYPDSSISNLIYKQLNDPIPLVAASRPDLPSRIDEVIQQATAKQPAYRYADAMEMAEAFQAAIQGIDTAVAIGVPEILPLVTEVYNPYKGLRAFREGDADDFFGREALVDQLITRLGESRFLAVVGPSGSGKSSAVKAGLLPALQQGALPGSKKWFTAQMVPGTHPLEELELALWPVAVDPPPSLVEPMERDTRGMLRTIRRILPDEENAQLLLIIDQFEELFTLVDDEERREFFIDSLITALRAPRTPLRVVVTLRADFYDRPLQIESIGRLLKENTEVVLPLTAEELTWAIRQPARRVGVSLESGLVESIVSDVSDQPGALPLMQYALTELFERRSKSSMTREAYENIGGVLAALGRRADEVYDGLGSIEQESARQLFLRLVTLGEGVEDTRRHVLRSEIEALQTSYRRPAVEVVDQIPDPQAPIPDIINRFGEVRLLTFDRDPVSREPTVEVAHEALLREWGTLRGWLDESRTDVRMQRILAAATAEWMAAGMDDGYLLRDARLNQFAGWAETSTVALTGDEQSFLEDSVRAREARQAEEESRRQRELETARQLAETERTRAEEQAQSAGRLRRRALLLAGALIVAGVLAIAALFFAGQSRANASDAEANEAVAHENEALAATREVLALAEADRRATAEADAQSNADLAATREMAAVDARATAEVEAEQRATAQAIAEEQRQAALVQASIGLASQALLELEGDKPERAVLLALEAVENYPYTWQAERALGQAVYAHHLQHILSHDDGVNTVEWSSDQRHILTASYDGTARIWDAETGAELVSVESPEGGQIFSAQWSPSEERFATLGIGNVAYIWDSNSGELVLTLEGHEDYITAAAWSPPGDKILTTSGDQTARIWDTVTGQALAVFEEHQATVYACEWNGKCPDFANAWSPGGDRVVTADEVGDIYIWDPLTGEDLAYLEGHEEWVNTATWSPDGQRIASASDDGTLRIWDASTGEEQVRWDGDLGIILSGLWSPGGDRVLLKFNLENLLMILDADTGEELVRYRGHGQIPWAGIWSEDGSRVLSGAGDGTARIWESATGLDIQVFKGHSADVNDVAWSPDGQYVVSASGDGTAKVWQVNGELIALEIPGDDGGFWAYNWSPGGDRVARSYLDGRVKVFDAVTGEELLSFLAHDELIDRVEFSPSGDEILTVARGNQAAVWDARTGEKLLDVEGGWHGNWSPDGRRFATGSVTIDYPARVWDRATGDMLFSLEHEGPQISAIYSPDGSRIATTSADGEARIWDAETGELIRNLLPPDFIRGLAPPRWSPDGRRLATYSEEGELLIFDVESGEVLQTITGHGGFVYRISWFPSGDRILAADVNNALKIWDVETGAELASFTIPDSNGAWLSPDGTQILDSVAGSGPLLIIDIWGSLDELVELARDCCVIRELTADERLRFGLDEG